MCFLVNCTKVNQRTVERPRVRNVVVVAELEHALGELFESDALALRKEQVVVVFGDEAFVVLEVLEHSLRLAHSCFVFIDVVVVVVVVAIVAVVIVFFFLNCIFTVHVTFVVVVVVVAYFVEQLRVKSVVEYERRRC